ncbi:transcriptional regulator [Streptococcus cuniculi]|uniref:Transcriptional regulator n=1 Tax=Streptococcus cuniculi TaxID=1432788 RepID=A0A1Q8EAB6_9STRE|nr:helix-turn-helix transcriptional regulator [Streptococcus cuniculi]OLF48734.1 transcriptional regulator [Streptococcus cuniculi]
MILADKIIRFRKKNGWSQEELAEKMEVSRQAVSKWEAAQTTPDLGKILQLSNLFGVTTDYLLKDELEDEEFIDSVDETIIRKITLAEANEYLKQRKDASVKIAIATFLCIICAIPLFLLIAISELTPFPIADNTAIGIGVISIFPIVAIAVYMFIRVGFKNAPYQFLDKEPFGTEYGVTGLVRDRQNTYHSTYVKYNYIGACGCILAPIPLLCGTFSENGLLTMLMLCITMLIVGISVMFFIVAGVRWSSMQRLLKEGDFSNKRKGKNKITEAIGAAYWLITTAIYLGWSFLTNDWHITWVTWLIAGILFGVVDIICNLVIDKQDEK